MVDAVVNDRPVRMMFDTGASTCLFGQNQFTQARVANVAMTTAKHDIGGVGNTVESGTAALVDLRVGGIRRKMPVMVIKHLDTEPLLGQTFYNGYHYDIDNTAGVIRFVKKTASRKSSYTTYDTIDIPFETVGNNMVVKAKINGHECPMYFDTGSYGVVMGMKTAAAVGLHVSRTARRSISQGVGGAVYGYEIYAGRIELGSMQQSGCTVTVLMDGEPPMPLLGQSFFKNRRFTVDNEKHLIRFSR